MRGGVAWNWDQGEGGRVTGELCELAWGSGRGGEESCEAEGVGLTFVSRTFGSK